MTTNDTTSLTMKLISEVTLILVYSSGDAEELTQVYKQIMKQACEARIREVEHATFIPVASGLVKEANTFNYTALREVQNHHCTGSILLLPTTWGLHISKGKVISYLIDANIPGKFSRIRSTPLTMPKQ